MRREFVKNLKERLRDNPAATIASVSQNDWFRQLHVPEMPGRRRRRRAAPPVSLLRFVNAVAADIEPEFPGVAIDTLGLPIHAETAPRSPGRGQTSSSACAASSARSAGRSTTRATRRSSTTSTGWSKIAGRLYIWDYTTNFSHYIQPHPNYASSPRTSASSSTGTSRGVFEQGAYQSWGSEMAELRAWILAKLLWNPGLVEGRLREEFLKGYYGACGRSHGRLPQGARAGPGQSR